jgi:enamine deaminase RidA (YjgF/YER057c/UK114 family)
MKREIVNPWSWQDHVGFVQGHAVNGSGRTIYCAGQTSVDADGNPTHECDMAAQIMQAIDNVEAVLRESGAGLSDIVRLTYYTTDVDAFFAAQDVLVARLREAGCRPTATLLGVSRLAFPPLLVEIEATAVAEAT